MIPSPAGPTSASEPDDGPKTPGAGEPRFCAYCGSPLEMKPRGDRLRAICTGCGRVLYRNPAVGVAVIVRRDQEVLLGRRRGSYAGMWCIPCGYVEWDEDIRDAAIREFREETGLDVRLRAIAAVHSNFHNPAQHTVGVWFEGEVIGGAPCAADDLSEIDFFSLDALPEPLAFPTDRLVLARLSEQTPR